MIIYANNDIKLTTTIITTGIILFPLEFFSTFSVKLVFSLFEFLVVVFVSTLSGLLFSGFVVVVLFSLVSLLLVLVVVLLLFPLL